MTYMERVDRMGEYLAWLTMNVQSECRREEQSMKSLSYTLRMEEMVTDAAL